MIQAVFRMRQKSHDLGLRILFLLAASGGGCDGSSVDCGGETAGLSGEVEMVWSSSKKR